MRINKSLRTVYQAAIAGSLLWSAGTANGQDVLVDFKFSDARLADVEGNVVQEKAGEQLAILLGSEFKYWRFRPGVGGPADYRISIFLRELENKDWEVNLALGYPSHLGPGKTWHSVLFPVGHLRERFGQSNPHGEMQWNDELGKHFPVTMLRYHGDDIRSELRNVPVGKTMSLEGTTGGGRRNLIPAVLTPVKQETASLTEASFKLLFQTEHSGALHLLAKSAPSLVNGKKNGRHPGQPGPTIHALVFAVVEPPNEKLILIDRLRNTLIGEGFLLVNENARFDRRLMAP